MDFKKLTEENYDVCAKDFEAFSKGYVEEYIQESFELFLKNLPGKRILDFGSGPGRDGLIFKNKGFSPVCIDLSSEMVGLCKKKGLEAHKMDFENLSFEKETFDGVWAYASLLHVPKKDLDRNLKNIKNLLVKKGLFYIGMREGNFEGLRNFARSKRKVYFSFYKKEELEKHLKKFFKIIHFSKVKKGKFYTYLNFICEKV